MLPPPPLKLLEGASPPLPMPMILGKICFSRRASFCIQNTERNKRSYSTLYRWRVKYRGVSINYLRCMGTPSCFPLFLRKEIISRLSVCLCGQLIPSSIGSTLTGNNLLQEEQILSFQS